MGDGTLDGLFNSLTGRDLPGGCDMCSAFQTVETLSDGVWHLVIHHDDACPVLRASRRRTN